MSRIERVDEVLKDASTMDGLRTIPLVAEMSDDGTVVGMPLTDSARNHLSTDLGIGVTYAKRCPTDLFAYNVNYWMREKKPNLDLVVRNDTIMEITESGAEIINPSGVIQMLDDILEKEDFNVVPDRWSFEPTRAFFNCYYSDMAFSMGNGKAQVVDTVHAGLDIQISPLGFTRTQLNGYLARLVCTNGMISRDSRISMMLNKSDSLEDSLAEIVSRRSELACEVTRFGEMQGKRLVNPTADAVRVATDLGYSRAFVDNLLNYLETGSPGCEGRVETMYELINLISWLGNDLDPWDQRNVQMRAGVSLSEAYHTCPTCASEIEREIEA